jgi:membrane protein DedA with SNARE-associated domain
MMLGIIGLPLPLEFLLIFAGSIAAATKLNIVWLIVIAWFGAMAGMNVNYGLGKTIGISSISKITKYIHLNEDKLNQLAVRFQKSGSILIVIGYFVTGLRHASPFLAGASGMSYKKFAFYAIAGGLLWISGFTFFGQKIGHHWHSMIKWLHHPLIILAIGGILLLAFLLKQRLFSSTSQT